jgi:hypothetical protein
LQIGKVSSAASLCPISTLTLTAILPISIDVGIRSFIDRDAHSNSNYGKRGTRPRLQVCTSISL